MAHYKLIIAYDGTAYHGFQRQANKTSVQLVLEIALRQLGWQGRAVLPSGRTDSGVHALGQVISFNLDWKHGDGDGGEDVHSRPRASSGVERKKVEPRLLAAMRPDL